MKGLLLLFSSLVTWQLAGQNCEQYGLNLFACGVPTSEMEYHPAQVQTDGEPSIWHCAASIQMVLNYHGLYVPQSHIVERIFGNANTNRETSEARLIESLSGWAADGSGRYSSIYAYGGYSNANEIVKALAAKWPLVVGLSTPNGKTLQCYVLTGIYFSYEMNKMEHAINAIPEKVVLRNPDPNQRSMQEMSWEEFQKRILFGLKIWVTRS